MLVVFFFFFSAWLIHPQRGTLFLSLCGKWNHFLSSYCLWDFTMFSALGVTFKSSQLQGGGDTQLWTHAGEMSAMICSPQSSWRISALLKGISIFVVVTMWHFFCFFSLWAFPTVCAGIVTNCKTFTCPRSAHLVLLQTMLCQKHWGYFSCAHIMFVFHCERNFKTLIFTFNWLPVGS